MNIRIAATLLFALILMGLLIGCTQFSAPATTNQPNQMIKEENAMIKTNPADGVMSKGVLTYSKTAFDEARRNNKIVVLDFAANWCPTCNANKPFIESGAKTLDPEQYETFIVHYKDDESNAETNEAIAQYNITGQHTIVVIGKDSQELGRTRQDFSDGSFASWVQSLN